MLWMRKVSFMYCFLEEAIGDYVFFKKNLGMITSALSSQRRIRRRLTPTVLMLRQHQRPYHIKKLILTENGQLLQAVINMLQRHCQAKAPGLFLPLCDRRIRLNSKKFAMKPKRLWITPRPSRIQWMCLFVHILRMDFVLTSFANWSMVMYAKCVIPMCCIHLTSHSALNIIDNV